MRRRALSLDAVYPTVAEDLSTAVKVVAPSFSRLRRMTAEERPEPDLNERYLFARAAPDSEEDSEDEPAPGKVREMVEVVDAVSDTTVRPLERVVTEALLADASDGEVDGILSILCIYVERWAY